MTAAIGSSERLIVNILQQTLVNRYSAIPQVASIYAMQSGKRLQVYVFTSNARYDDGLLSALIDVEHVIADTFPEQTIEITYPPLTLVDPTELIDWQGYQLWQRELRVAK